MKNSQYKAAVKRVEVASMANPYKFEKKDEWARICEKYDEEDKSKKPKKEKK